mmetsp:Transcript_11807/g.13727  ORF Transcript_11807/g.13727 Transcript_11807/m.13727 type:complete len:207 (-) Transcript_11807:370-990(-)
MKKTTFRDLKVNLLNAIRSSEEQQIRKHFKRNGKAHENAKATKYLRRFISDEYQRCQGACEAVDVQEWLVARWQILELLHTNPNGSFYSWGGEVDKSKKSNRSYRDFFEDFVRLPLEYCPEIWKLDEMPCTLKTRYALQLTVQHQRWLVNSIKTLHYWCRPKNDIDEALPPYVVAGVFTEIDPGILEWWQKGLVAVYSCHYVSQSL